MIWGGSYFRQGEDGQIHRDDTACSLVFQSEDPNGVPYFWRRLQIALDKARVGQMRPARSRDYFPGRYRWGCIGRMPIISGDLANIDVNPTGRLAGAPSPNRGE